MTRKEGYPRTRLYSEAPLGEGVCVAVEGTQAHYLLNVLRLKENSPVCLFNGRDGEWLADIQPAGKKSLSLRPFQQIKPQRPSPDLWLLAAPLKHGRSEYVMEKATELGISRFMPVVTAYTVVDRLNPKRLAAIATQAAEQSERMDVPAVEGVRPLSHYLQEWPADRTLVYADESGASGEAKTALLSLQRNACAVLIGPEGGFSAEELAMLYSMRNGCGISMGPRIMRADTAAIAALTLVQAWVGDWSHKPAFRSGQSS